MAQHKATSAPQVHQSYQSAITINNVGVHLLERQCYGQAVESFKDAAALMKTILFDAIETNSGEPTSQSDNGADLLQRSMLSLAHLKPSKKRAMHMEQLIAMEDGNVVSCKVSETNTFFAESILEASPSSTVAFPIRIRNNLLLEMKGGMKYCPALSVQAAMIWHNLGIAYLCRSKTCSISTRRQKLRQSALGYLGSAHAVLETNYAVQYDDSVDEESSVTPRDAWARSLPCLMMAVLATYIYLLQASHQGKRAVELYSSLVRCRFALCSMDNLSATSGGAQGSSSA